MSPVAELIVGPGTKLPEGLQTPSRATYDGAQLAQALHGDYLAAALRQKLFVAAVQAGVTSSVGLATTYTGLVVSNPIGSLVNLAIMRIGLAQSVINAAVNAFGYGGGIHTTTQVVHTTPVAPRNCFLGAPAGVALADVAATLPIAPTYMEFFSDTPGATTNPVPQFLELRGSLVVPPGGFVCTLAIAASPAAALWPSIMWEEIPI